MSTVVVKERPILFHARSIQGILEGRKTQTRRIVKYKRNSTLGLPDVVVNPYGQPGDRLWVTVDASLDRKETALVDRFWSRVFKPNGESGCWEWFGSVNRKKYGVVRSAAAHLSVHRLSYEWHHSLSLQPEQHILHKCDLRWCVNPAHLYLGSNDDNVRDKVERNRQPRQCGEDNGQSRLTVEDIENIRRLRTEGTLQRDIAVLYGTSQAHISKILSGTRWANNSINTSLLTGSRTLEITDIRVERVQEITIADCIAEGVLIPHGEPMYADEPLERYSEKHAFEKLWNDTNGKLSWDANPFVWVIRFRRI